MNLAEIEKAATAKNDKPELAAIVTMREVADARLKDPEAPPAPAGISKTLQKAHSDYLAARAAVDRQFEPRRQKNIDDLILKLTAYEAGLPADSATRRDVAAIKKDLAEIPKWGSASAQKPTTPTPKKTKAK